MQKTLILLAGPPGTGKSHFGAMIQKEMPIFSMISPDTIREAVFDEYGFDDLAEKKRLTGLAWERYYGALEDGMKKGKMLLSDYPFSWKQHDRLKELGKRHGYRILTVRLGADLRILFERQRERDLDAGRHPGHIFSQYHKGKESLDRSKADDLVTFAHFVARAKDRGYASFQIGDLITIDVTDFETAQYKQKIQLLKGMLQRRHKKSGSLGAEGAR